MAMMPAFATHDAADLGARATVNVPELTAAVRRAIDDGVDAIATTGTFGEFHTLLQDEFRTLCEATVAAVGGRVPLFIGCTSTNPRQVVDNIRVAREAGAAGVFIGAPFYVPLDLANVVRFFGDVADLFPDTSVMLYHNPPLQRVHLKVDAFAEIARHPNIVAMKDSHRDTRAFIELQEHVRGRISVFVGTWQFYPFVELGAAGLWSYDCWMGPGPVLALRDAAQAGDAERAIAITRDIHLLREGPPSLEWREMAARVAIAHAGYCDPGPLRPPFIAIPEAVRDAAVRRGARWRELCERWSPLAVTSEGPRTGSSTANES
jgi:dihydrodipicolinate synthase/N-acetylneuraminate lyase